ALDEASTPEKPVVLTVGTEDHPICSHLHRETTVLASNDGGNTTKASNYRRVGSFKRSPPHRWAISPPGILIFFATLSSMGTMLLIYFTLSMERPIGEDNALNW
ncbi:hypothetical protein U1Q18_010829, partial [Sarracenia purpurea var. burkii]